MYKIRISTRRLKELSLQWRPLLQRCAALSPATGGSLRYSTIPTPQRKSDEDWQYHTGYWIPFVRFGPKRRMKIYTKPPTRQDQERVARIDRLAYSLITSCAIGGTLYFVLGDGPHLQEQIFNAPKFTPFTIIGREAVSTTCFILTIRPANVAAQLVDPYEIQWKHGIWSVEIKQPQLQIARSYTPLPPPIVNARFDSKPGDLRFLIRKEQGGEVSNYLAGLAAGRQVELRGPHAGFDLPDHAAEVLFLAGGTGIAPAMQVAHSLLNARATAPAKIHIVWANRRREDCLSTGRISRELETLRTKHPESVQISILVDEEGTKVDQKMVSGLTRNTTPGKSGSVTTRIDSRLLFVSGPEGFVNFLAGPKVWKDGLECQGEVGGLLRKLGLRDWKVWKL